MSSDSEYFESEMGSATSGWLAERTQELGGLGRSLRAVGQTNHVTVMCSPLNSRDKSDAPLFRYSCCKHRWVPGWSVLALAGRRPTSPASPTLCSSVQSPGSHLCLRAPGSSTVAKPGRDMELNRLVQDQPPSQVALGRAPPNLVDHLPNVPSYRPPVTRIPVLISRRTALSNSSFAKETRSSGRRLGSVTSPPARPRRDARSAWLGLLPCMGATVMVRTTSWAHGRPPLLPLLISAFTVLCGCLRGFSPILSVPNTL